MFFGNPYNHYVFNGLIDGYSNLSLVVEKATIAFGGLKRLLHF